MSKKAEILAELGRRYPCQAIPTGGLKDVGQKFGVTREYVRQIARQANYGRIFKSGTVCPMCGGTKMRASQWCQACYSASKYVELPCNYCGAPVRRLASQLVAGINQKPQRTPTGLAVRSGNVYCNRTCLGHWLAENHGFIAHPENGRAGQSK